MQICETIADNIDGNRRLSIERCTFAHVEKYSTTFTTDWHRAYHSPICHRPADGRNRHGIPAKGGNALYWYVYTRLLYYHEHSGQELSEAAVLVLVDLTYGD